MCREECSFCTRSDGIRPLLILRAKSSILRAQLHASLTEMIHSIAHEHTSHEEYVACKFHTKALEYYSNTVHENSCQIQESTSQLRGGVRVVFCIIVYSHFASSFFQFVTELRPGTFTLTGESRFALCGQQRGCRRDTYLMYSNVVAFASRFI
jgi:hypothetical protein